MADSIDDVVAAQRAVDGLTSAYEEAADAIRRVADPDRAFGLSSELGIRLVELGKTNRALRTEMLERVRVEHSLDLGKRLAEHVTQTGYPMTKQGANALLSGRRDVEGEAA